MRNLIKKILKESEDDGLDWVRDVPVGIELEPNTLYYFDPPLSIKEIPQFANRIINSNSIKKLLLDDFTNSLLYSGDPGVNYFVTMRNLEGGVYGWCSEIDIEGAIDSYPRQNPVNAREKFIF